MAVASGSVTRLFSVVDPRPRPQRFEALSRSVMLFFVSEHRVASYGEIADTITLQRLPSNNVILQNEPPNDIDRMIQYCYTGEYSRAMKVGRDAGACECGGHSHAVGGMGLISDLIQHIDMFAMGHRLTIPGLQEVA